MAKDQGQPDLTGKDIDLDSIDVEIAILAKNPKQLSSTCAFLGRRGWPTVAIGNISQLIEYVSDKRPDIVLVSLSHPSPAAGRLPDLLAQTFNTTCIGFIEIQDTANSQRLIQHKMRHKLNGPASGPSLQRAIRRVLAETLNINEDDKGGASSGANRNAVEADSADESKAKMNSGMKMFSNEKPKAGSSIVQISGGNADGNGPKHNNRTLDLSARESGLKGKADIESSGAHTEEVVSNGKYTMGAKKRRSLKELRGQPANPSVAQTGVLLDPTSVKDASTGAVAISTGTKGPASQGSTPTPDLVAMLKKSLFGEGGPNPAEEGEPVATMTGPEAPIANVHVDVAQEAKSPLASAIEDAMTEVCERNAKVQPIPLNHVTRVGVYPFDSPEKPGYLVIAVEVTDRLEQDGFLRTCELALDKSMKAAHIDGAIEPGFWIDVPKTEFHGWTDSSAEFTLYVEHLGAELGVAFFPTAKAMVKPRPVTDGSMFAVSINDISTDQSVTFKAYLHMEKNKKFFLYLRNGRRLQEEQKKRLKEKEITEVFMKPLDVENLRVFLASVYIQESIRKARPDAA